MLRGVKLYLFAAVPLALVACAAEKPAAVPPLTTASPGPETQVGSATSSKSTAPLYQFEEKTIDGAPIRLDAYAGKVLLIVNVASKCGYTPQYEGLEKVYEQHKAEGFEILAFPCDQFGNQEPGTEAEIKTFCTTRYSVSFPMFSKIEVNGPNANPLYSFLRKDQPIKWNFTKFLVDRNGSVVKRFESKEKPEAIEPEIAALLAKK
jgi:glutathione peroxidase